MSYQDRLTSPGPARDDPLLGDTTTPTPDATAGYGTANGGYDQPVDTGSGASTTGSSTTDTARQAAETGREQAQNVASTAKGEAQNVASTAKDEAQNVAQTAKDEARNVAGTAKGQARRLAGEARTELRTQADGQVNRLADGISQISQQLRSVGDKGDPGPVTDLAGEAAWRTQQVADRLRDGGFEETLSQVRRFGRNKPGLFLLGAFGVGLVAGRVVRNLAQDPTEDDGGNGRRAYGDATYAGTAGYGNAGYATTAYDPYAAPAMPSAPVDPAIASDPYGAPAIPSAPVDPANAAYGAPATPDRPEGTAPVSDQRWGT